MARVLIAVCQRALGELEGTVRRSPRDRVPVHRRPLLLDNATVLVSVQYSKRLLVEEFDHLAHVPFAVDTPREDDEIEFAQQVRRESLLDDTVDQRLDVCGVCRPDEAVTRVEYKSISR